MMKPIQLLIVEDEPDIRGKLLKLADHPLFKSIAVATDLSSAQSAIKATKPDVLLLDIGLPDGNGLSLLAALFAKLPKCEVIVFTVFGDEASILKALKSGARGYILKDTPISAIPNLIQKQLEGGAPLSPAISALLLKQLQNHGQPSPLSKTETTVLTYFAKGLNYEEVANLLNVKVSTIATHAKNIYRKMGVHNRSAAVYEAQQSGWLNP